MHGRPLETLSSHITRAMRRQPLRRLMHRTGSIHRDPDVGLAAGDLNTVPSDEIRYPDDPSDCEQRCLRGVGKVLEKTREQGHARRLPTRAQARLSSGATSVRVAHWVATAHGIVGGHWDRRCFLVRRSP